MGGLQESIAMKVKLMGDRDAVEREPWFQERRVVWRTDRKSNTLADCYKRYAVYYESYKEGYVEGYYVRQIDDGSMDINGPIDQFPEILRGASVNDVEVESLAKVVKDLDRRIRDLNT